MRFCAFYFLILPVSALFAFKEPDANELINMSLDELLNMEVGVTSEGNAKSLRESPGIITVFSEEDLAKLPIRDLLDLFEWVPGFFTGVDVQGVVGLGIRGNWGHEGKILLVIDGMEMNELLYSTNAFGNHYPLANIKKVEIIRGPGSALYGGNAELAVISLTTKSGSELDGSHVSLINGEMADVNARRNLQWLWGGKRGQWDLSLSAFIGEGHRSDQTYQDLFGNQFDMSESNELNPHQYSFAAVREALEIRLFWEDYQTTTQDLYDVALSEPADVDFKTQNIQVKYTWNWSESLKLIPRLRFRQYESWQQLDRVAREEEILFDDDVHRVSGNVNLIYTPGSRIEWVFGFGGYQENAKTREFDEEGQVSDTGAIEFVNYSGFAQASFSAFKWNWTLGGRFEQHNEFGETFVPRLAATGLFGKWHYKGLFSQAFRSPNVENFSLNSDIEPERTTVFEVEVGYQLSSSSFMTMNLFDNKISDPIVYFFDETEQYKNFERVATRGIEAEYRYQKGPWSAIMSFSTYEKVENEVLAYEVESDDRALLGVPEQKMGLRINRQSGRNWSLSMGLHREGKKWGYVATDEEGHGILGSYDPTNNLHLQSRHKDPFGLKGLSLTLGLFNLLDEEIWYVQPYDSYHAALPGGSRELFLRLDYKF